MFHDNTRDSIDEFRRLVERGAPANDLAVHLEVLSPAQRVQAVARVRGRLVARLYSLVEKTRPLRLEDMVASTTPAGATVTYQGRNSLPAFSRFQKRLTRTADGVVFGYNKQPMRLAGAATGPGYFVVTEAEDHEGELLFDYTKPPPFEPAGWPAYRPNEIGLSRVVFMDLNDYVRRVTTGVVVGAAFRRGRHENAYFTLTALRV
jgi:hypothetical protein